MRASFEVSPEIESESEGGQRESNLWQKREKLFNKRGKETKKLSLPTTKGFERAKERHFFLRGQKKSKKELQMQRRRGKVPPFSQKDQATAWQEGKKKEAIKKRQESRHCLLWGEPIGRRWGTRTRTNTIPYGTEANAAG